MLIKSADFRVLKQHAAATIRLQSVLVRIDHDGVRFSQPCEGPFGIFCKIFRQREISAVCCVRMYSEPMFFAKRKDLQQRIHRTRCRCTHRRYNGPNVAAFHTVRQCFHVHPGLPVAWHGFEWQLQNPTNPPVRVVSLLACENLLPRMQLSRHP